MTANWDRLWRQSLLYAAYEEKRYATLPHRCRDIVQTAIEKTFSGERTWDPEVCDLSHHLRMTIRSLYNSAYGRLQSRQKHARLSQAEVAHVPTSAKAQEDLDYLRKAVRQLRLEDPALAKFFVEACRLLTTSCETEREAAQMMNIAPSTFTKNKARIARILSAQANEMDQEAQR